MEEDLGALERANELRNFSMQERVEVVRPANFTTMPQARAGVLAPVFEKISSWFQAREENARFQARQESAGAGPLPPMRVSGEEGLLSGSEFDF